MPTEPRPRSRWSPIFHPAVFLVGGLVTFVASISAQLYAWWYEEHPFNSLSGTLGDSLSWRLMWLPPFLVLAAAYLWAHREK